MSKATGFFLPCSKNLHAFMVGNGIRRISYFSHVFVWWYCALWYQKIISEGKNELWSPTSRMSVFEKSVGNGLQHCETFEVFLSYGGFWTWPRSEETETHFGRQEFEVGRNMSSVFPYEGIGKKNMGQRGIFCYGVKNRNAVCLVTTHNASPDECWLRAPLLWGLHWDKLPREFGTIIASVWFMPCMPLLV